MVGFIVYGSLYPFHFEAGAGAHPIARLASSWRWHPDHFGNLIGNICLYMPLGLFGVLSIGRRVPAIARLGLALATGVLLCVMMELIQLHVPGRVSTMADVYPNTLGTALGAVAGLVLGAEFGRSFSPTFRARPVPILLLLAFLMYRLFPYAPSLDISQYWDALKPVVHHPKPSAYDTARYAVTWLVVAALAAAVIDASRARWLMVPAILFVLGAQIVIMNNRIGSAELVGAAIAVPCWLLVSHLDRRPQACVLAMALAGLVAAERLLPFDWLAVPHSFGWIPFQSFLHGSMALNTQSFLEKFFLYGSLVWLLTRATARPGVAGGLVALMLFATSLLQTHLPNRSAELTDALLAVIITGLFALIDAAFRKPAAGPGNRIRRSEASLATANGSGPGHPFDDPAR